MVVAHHRHNKSTGDMLAALNRPAATVKLNVKSGNHEEDKDDQDDERQLQRHEPLLGAFAEAPEEPWRQGHADRWVSCKVLDLEQKSEEEEEEEEQSFLSGKHKVEWRGANELGAAQPIAGHKQQKRREFKSAGNLSLLFSLFQAPPSQQKHKQAPWAKKSLESEGGAQETRASSDSAKTPARVTSEHNLAPTTPTRLLGQRPEQQQQQQQQQQERQQDSNLTSGSSPHLPATGDRRRPAGTNEIWTDYDSTARARRRRQFAGSSHGQALAVLKPSRVKRAERRLPLGQPRRAPARRARELHGRDNNATSQHSGRREHWSSCSSLASESESESDGGDLEGGQVSVASPQPTLEVHKKRASNGANSDSEPTALANSRLVAQDSLACDADDDDGRSTRSRRAVRHSGERALDNARESGLPTPLSFPGLAAKLHNQTQEQREQQLAATAASALAGNHLAQLAAQDARRSAIAGQPGLAWDGAAMRGGSSPPPPPPTWRQLACQLAPACRPTRAACRNDAATTARPPASCHCGTVLSVGHHHQSLACITSPDAGHTSVAGEQNDAPGKREVDSRRQLGASQRESSTRAVAATGQADGGPPTGWPKFNQVQALTGRASSAESSEQASTRAAGSGSPSSTGCSQQDTASEPHMVDLGGATSKLLDTCASSWRQALMATSPVLSNLSAGVTSSAGSYKVAQRQRASESPALQQQQQQQQWLPAPPAAPTPNALSLMQHNSSQQANANPASGTDFARAAARLGGRLSSEEVAPGEQELSRQQEVDINKLAATRGRTPSGCREQRVQGEGAQQQQQQQQQQQHAQTDTCHQTAAAASSNRQQQQRTRLTRPGRSPISLQRQTNARLARHRLKIQQQRQEQLTRLALSERAHVTTTRGGAREFWRQAAGASPLPQPAASAARGARACEPNNTSEIEIVTLEEETDQQQRRGRENDVSGSLLRGLLERLSFTSKVSSGRAVALVNFGEAAATSGRSRNHRAHQNFAHSQRQQAAASTSIEICDSLQPGSSGGGRQAREASASHVIGLGLTSGPARSSVSSSSSSSNNNNSALGRRRELGDMQQQLAGGAAGNQRQQQQQQQQQQHASHRQQYESSKSLESEACSSASSSTLSLDRPFCKICHLSSTKNGNDKLISPCKCSGTMQYIHCGCLLKWLEISNRTNEKPISCELCSHEYTWHKRFNYKQMKVPRCSVRDLLLHLIFLLALGGMLFCALAPMFNRSVKPPADSLPLQQDESRAAAAAAAASTMGDGRFGQQEPPRVAGTHTNLRPSFRSHFSGFSSSTSGANGAIGQASAAGSGKLASEEKFILLCAAFFFISFFVCIYAQTKTRDTLYGLIVKFANMNLTYYITEYDHGTTASATNDNHTAPSEGQRQVSSPSADGLLLSSSSLAPVPPDGKRAHHDRYRPHQASPSENRRQPRLDDNSRKGSV